jgi:hypothetical protein
MVTLFAVNVYSQITGYPFNGNGEPAVLVDIVIAIVVDKVSTHIFSPRMHGGVAVIAVLVSAGGVAVSIIVSSFREYIRICVIAVVGCTDAITVLIV